MILSSSLSARWQFPDMNSAVLIIEPRGPDGRREGPQCFTQAHVLAAFKLADREGLSCVRSYGIPVVLEGVVGETYRAPEPAHADDRTPADWKEAADWLAWRNLGHFVGAAAFKVTPR